MSVYKSEDIIGWENNNEEFLCCDCFDEKHKDDSVGWTPVEEQEDYLYICDNCQQRV